MKIIRSRHSDLIERTNLTRSVQKLIAAHIGQSNFNFVCLAAPQPLDAEKIDLACKGLDPPK